MRFEKGPINLVETMMYPNWLSVTWEYAIKFLETLKFY